MQIYRDQCSAWPSITTDKLLCRSGVKTGCLSPHFLYKY